jgi:hypothetical protein
MLGLKEELQIRRWAREEAANLIQERIQIKQDTCEHLVSGTIKDSVLTCDFCEKALTPEDEWYPEARSAPDARYTDFAKEQK